MVSFFVYNSWPNAILGDPGAVSRVDKMFVVKVDCKVSEDDRTLVASRLHNYLKTIEHGGVVARAGGRERRGELDQY